MSDSSSERRDVLASETPRSQAFPESRAAGPSAIAARSGPLPTPAFTASSSVAHRPDRLGGTTLPARPHACRRYLKLRVRNVTYGVPASQVREIVYRPELSPAGSHSQPSSTLANLRGHVVPVLDAAQLVLGADLDHADLGRADLAPDCLVVLEVSGGGGAESVIGLLVDGVEEVVQVREDHGAAHGHPVAPPLRNLEPLVRAFLRA
ncbi:MAG: chemotaxis protein CheW [Verrucomicrobiales bacterium]|nr:chemotaxis protein CheW [Verrucomicrobiales bacterium]